MRNRKGHVNKEKTARRKVRKRTRKEERKANPAPGPIYAWRGREKAKISRNRKHAFLALLLFFTGIM